MSAPVIEPQTERPTRMFQPLTKRLGAAQATRQGRRRDAGMSAVEYLGLTLLAIIIVGLVGAGVKGAFTTKTTNVSNCITTSDSTQNGTGTGCK
ncbi:hypothetical protein ACFW1A_00585 [Kitasatospora sp. NPDC058965]|uniref:hypothetical protein n=1 Tax=Kitasatospora sp. NPDC058965 TaxID=3346682 RepID=UPI00369B985D